MNPPEFLTLARQLAAGNSEAEWRSAVSRAYYAAFHVARRLFEDLGFRVPRAEQAHIYLAHRLQNCGEPAVQQAGIDLDALRRIRNQADYDLHQPWTAALAVAQVLVAEQVIQALDAAALEPTRTQISDAMRVYEQTVLRVVTWQKP